MDAVRCTVHQLASVRLDCTPNRGVTEQCGCSASGGRAARAGQRCARRADDMCRTRNRLLCTLRAGHDAWRRNHAAAWVSDRRRIGPGSSRRHDRLRPARACLPTARTSQEQGQERSIARARNHSRHVACLERSVCGRRQSRPAALLAVLERYAKTCLAARRKLALQPRPSRRGRPRLSRRPTQMLRHLCIRDCD